MVRQGRSKGPSKFKGPSKNFNAKGYAKRLALKSKTASSNENVSDVYEYQTEKNRRSKIKLQLERDEIAGLGRDDYSGSEEGDEGRSRGGPSRPRLVGGSDDEGGGIGEDEDEEIDSDGAFDESDEDRFAGFSFGKQKKSAKAKGKQKAVPRTVRFAEVDLNEDEDDGDVLPEKEHVRESSDEEEEEEEEGDSDEFIDVLDIMDGKGDPQSEEETGEVEREDEGTPSSHQKRHLGLSRQSSDGDSEDESGGSGDDESRDHFQSEDDISMSEYEDGAMPDTSALQGLEAFITNLDASKKRKADEDTSTQEAAQPDRRQKRRILKDRTEAGEENEFATHHGATKLNLDDLLAPLDASSNLQSLKKSAKILTSKSTKNQTLSAPLPQRTQERLDREAAYEQTKGEVDKWNATMQRIKEAEFLSFPLQAKPEGKVSNLELAAKFKPTTELESAVDKLLKSAKMREQDIAQTESLKMNHLSVEEVSSRRAELAKMRDLMFRAEAKAKRIAKIKSKTYRRLRKKEKQKLAAKLGEDSDDEDMTEEGRMKKEVQRARERATLRHKNTGKWAKAMKGRGELDEDQRRDINEMLDRGEKLRRRIQGEESGSEGVDDDDDSDGEVDEGTIKAGAFEELSALRRDEGISVLPDSGGKGKSIFEMKFMQDAMARDQQRVDQMADDFLKEMGHHTNLSPEAEDHSLDGTATQHDAAVGVTMERVGGRVSYRPGIAAGSISLRTVGSLASDTSSVTLKSTDLLPDTTHPIPSSPETLLSPIFERPPSAIPNSTSLASPPPTQIETPNPWLVHSTNSAKAIQRKHEVVVSKDSGSAEKSKNKLRKRGKNMEEEKEQARNDATVDISMSNVMTLGVPASSASTAGRRSEGADIARKADTSRPSNGIVPEGGDDDDGDGSDLNSEVEEQERLLDRKGKGRAKGGVRAFAQRDLVAQAFAGDNVVQEFAEAKRREMEEDAPTEVDTTLPGWGSWGGAGTKKAAPKPHLIKKVAGIDPKSRADYGKSHVIISEKRDKKASKYLVKDLPYPYTSKAQFERSMDTPIGTEWNTRVGFQRGTLPKVVTKMGTVISPLEKLV